MRHRVLFLEDVVANYTAVAQYLDACGIDCVGVPSLEEARPLIDRGDFCALLSDLEILPTAASTKADLSLGYMGIEYARTRYPAHNGQTHLLPILVISGHTEFEVAQRALRMRADDFLTKPPTELSERVVLALHKAGRSDHSRCAEVTEAARARALASSSTLVAASRQPKSLRIMPPVNGRVPVQVGHKEAWLTPTLARALLHLIVGRLRSGEGWVARSEMGRDATAVVRALSRLREELGQRIDEADKARGYRLLPEIALERVPTSDLAKMTSEAVIARLAGEIARTQKI